MAIGDEMDVENQAKALKMQNITKATDCSYALAGDVVARVFAGASSVPDASQVAGAISAIAQTLKPVMLQDLNKAIDESVVEAKRGNPQTPSIP